MEESSIVIRVITSNMFRGHIHTLKGGPVVGMFFRHEITIVLTCPVRGTGVSSWYHKDGLSGDNIADCTRNIMLIVFRLADGTFPHISYSAP